MDPQTAIAARKGVAGLERSCDERVVRECARRGDADKVGASREQPAIRSTSRTQAFRRVTRSCWGRHENPGIALAKSTTALIEGR